MRKDDLGVPFDHYATGSTSATAFQAASSGKQFYLTDISAYTDLAGGTITVYDGTTVVWKRLIYNQDYDHTFKTPIIATVSSSIAVTVEGTSLQYVCITGFAYTPPA